jgi:hypothetical protein
MSGPLVWVVDERRALPPVIHQGRRPTCLALATTTAHNHQRQADHSVEYLHYKSRSYGFGVGSISAISSALALDGQPPEDQWPYDTGLDEAVTLPAPPSALGGPFMQARVRAAPTSPASILTELEAGQLPVVGLKVTLPFARAEGGVVLEAGLPADGHAVTVVGAATYRGADHPLLARNDTLLLVRNTWGPSWGRDGHALVGPAAWAAMTVAALVVEPT